jgi:hypothetical protein
VRERRLTAETEGWTLAHRVEEKMKPSKTIRKSDDAEREKEKERSSKPGVFKRNDEKRISTKTMNELQNARPTSIQELLAELNRQGSYSDDYEIVPGVTIGTFRQAFQNSIREAKKHMADPMGSVLI